MNKSSNNTKRILDLILTQSYNKEDPLEEIALLAKPYQLHALKKGSTLIYQKDPARYVYFILRGTLVVLNSIEWVQDAILAYVSSPHIIGLTEVMMDIDMYTAFVVANEDCILFRIDAEEFMEILNQDARLCFLTLKAMASMADENMNYAERHRVFPPKDILGHYLYNLADGNLPYRCPLTRKMIAEELNINLRSLYRYLDYFKNLGRIRLEHGKIVIGVEEFRKLEERYGDLIM